MLSLLNRSRRCFFMIKSCSALSSFRLQWLSCSSFSITSLCTLCSSSFCWCFSSQISLCWSVKSIKFAFSQFTARNKLMLNQWKYDYLLSKLWKHFTKIFMVFSWIASEDLYFWQTIFISSRFSDVQSTSSVIPACRRYVYIIVLLCTWMFCSWDYVEAIHRTGLRYNWSVLVGVIIY